jgi:hypothetical protein
MDKEEIIGKIIIQQFERKEKLRRKISDPAYRYYFRGIRRSVSSLLFILVSIVLLIQSFRNPASVFIVVFIAILVAFSEIIRQGERFNALVDLIEIEKEEQTKCEPRGTYTQSECCVTDKKQASICWAKYRELDNLENMKNMIYMPLD